MLKTTQPLPRGSAQPFEDRNSQRPNGRAQQHVRQLHVLEMSGPRQGEKDNQTGGAVEALTINSGGNMTVTS